MSETNIKSDFSYVIPTFSLFLFLITYGIFEFDKKQNKSKLEKLADENKNGKLDSNEKIKMYKMCELKDTTAYLSALSLEKGLTNYQTETDSLNKIYK